MRDIELTQPKKISVGRVGIILHTVANFLPQFRKKCVGFCKNFGIEHQMLNLT